MRASTNNEALIFMISVALWVGLGLLGFFNHAGADEEGFPTPNIHLTPVIAGVLRLCVGVFAGFISVKVQYTTVLIWKLLCTAAIFAGAMWGFGGDSASWHYFLLGAVGWLDAHTWNARLNETEGS